MRSKHCMDHARHGHHAIHAHRSAGDLADRVNARTRGRRYRVDIPETSYKDEIADMVSAVKVFRENAIERARLKAERAEHAAKLDRKNQQLGKALKQLESLGSILVWWFPKPTSLSLYAIMFGGEGGIVGQERHRCRPG